MRSSAKKIHHRATEDTEVHGGWQGRVAKLVEIGVTRVSIWQTTRSGSLNKSLLSRGDVKALPAVDLAQRDLTAGHQGPEEHASGGGAGQQALCLDAALELFVQSLDGIGGADRAPLLGWEAQEGEEQLPGLLQTVGDGAALEAPLAQERLALGV